MVNHGFLEYDFSDEHINLYHIPLDLGGLKFPGRLSKSVPEVQPDSQTLGCIVSRKTKAIQLIQPSTVAARLFSGDIYGYRLWF